jgi:peptide/nickel transport system substrate-binding protein
MTQEIAQFNFAINAEGGNEFIGSGQLDGAGIPPDFFSDIHVRRGFSYCFDWDAYLKEAQQGEAVQSRGPIARGLSGYTEDSPVYARDIEKCREELAQAWGGQLPETGFSLSVAYNEGGTARQIAGQILAAGLQEANPKYKLDTMKLEWPTMLDNMNQRRLPITFAGWYEDYHDASNWVHPYMHAKSGAYAPNQGFPPEMVEKYTGLVDQALAETDAAKREAIYRELQQLAHDDAIDLFLAQMLGRTYMRREVSGWFFSPLQPSFQYYNLSKGAE